MNLTEMLRLPETRVVDVRTPEEFAEGHVPGSINIPLDQVDRRVEEFQSLGSPLILCCRSGARSGRATEFLRSKGLTEVYNGGGWTEVVRYLP